MNSPMADPGLTDALAVPGPTLPPAMGVQIQTPAAGGRNPRREIQGHEIG
jgi:hypothetical protein